MKIKLLSSLLLLILFIETGISGTPQRTASTKAVQGAGRKDWTETRISEHLVVLTNNGMFGQRHDDYAAQWKWPRGSSSNYIYGGGIWFGAKKSRVVNGKDTVEKAVELGYNPNSGVGWFVPGRISDGPEVLSESDPRSANDIVYRSTEYDRNGKNVVDPTKPDWPIRWLDTTKTPGINEYYGDYIADPALRSALLPVYISQEDIFCVYKDTDVGFNVEYKQNSPYPLGIEVEQTIYSWNHHANKDLLAFRYMIRNRSNDDLKECYLAVVSDPDIGFANNDRSGYYAKDTTLHLIYGFSEKENGYPGVLGVSFLSTPVVRSIEDSISYRLLTGRSALIGEQIGMSTFRNWMIENDPSGKDARYDFMSGNVREGDTGAGDKRLITSTGPFNLKSGESAQSVVGMMIAPGIGIPVSGDVQNTPFLDSLILLAKHARMIVTENKLSMFPTADVHQTSSGSNSTIEIVLDARTIKGVTANGRLFTETGVLIAETPLFDDGSHKDGVAGDWIFGGSVTVAPQSEAMYLNSVITDESNAIYEWKKLRSFITTAPITAESPVVLSDNVNNDGKANKGETVRFSIPIVNPNSFALKGLKIKVLVNGTEIAGQLTIPSLQPNGRFDPVYYAYDPSSYCTVVIPGSFAGTGIPTTLVITDSSDNTWKREIVLAVHTPVNDRVGMKRRAGKSSIVPTITVIDNKAYLEHYYIVQGVDSVGIGGTPGFKMKDSSAGTTVLNNTILNTESIAGFGTPVVNGLKLHWSGVHHEHVETRSLVYSSSDSLRFPGFDPDFVGFPTASTARSSMRLSEYRDIRIRFSQRTSLTDLNGNGKWDRGEPYGFDTTNAVRTQRAYFYRRVGFFSPVWSFAGVRRIPFTAFDIESPVPRQLDVVVMDNDSNGQWDLAGGTNTSDVYIMGTTYDSTGVRYDSTQGGVNFIPVLMGKAKAPINYTLTIFPGDGDPLAIEGDCDILLTRPLTSQDEFIIGPGDFVTSVPSTTIPAEYRLYQNYPNPFNPVTTIRYSTPNAAHASVRVYNILGQLVKVLADRPHSAGEHIVEWDGTNVQQRSVPSGVYFYRLEAGSFSEVRKMLLLK